MVSKRRHTLSTTKKISLVCVIGLAVFIILLSGAPMLSKPLVEMQLKRFSDYIAAQAQQDGSEASLTHEGVTVEGWGYGKKAIIAKPVFSLAGPQTANSTTRQTLQVTTGSMVISADNTRRNKYYIDLPEPLTFSENGAVSSTVQFSQPLRVGVEQRISDNTLVLPYEVQLPTQMMVSYADSNQKPTVITYNASPVVRGWLMPVSGANSSEVAFQNIQLSEQEGAASVSIGSFASTMKRSAPDNGRTAVETSVVVNDLALKNAEKVQGPYSFKLMLDGTRALLEPGAKGVDADYNLRELSFTSDQLSMSAGGVFSQKPDDSLPFGTINFTLRNVSVFLASDMLKPEDKSFVVTVLQRVTGTDPTTAQELSFSVNREKNSTLHIGNSTLEELMMALLSRAMSSGQAQPAPAPAAPVPAPAPESAAPATPPATESAAPVVPVQ